MKPFGKQPHADLAAIGRSIYIYMRHCPHLESLTPVNQTEVSHTLDWLYEVHRSLHSFCAPLTFNPSPHSGHYNLTALYRTFLWRSRLDYPMVPHTAGANTCFRLPVSQVVCDHLFETLLRNTNMRTAS